jgi:peptidoglycan/xylan/chitin deacetylase (PgdA/CDA1 family)
MGRLLRILVTITISISTLAPFISSSEYVSRKGFVTLQFDDSHWLHYYHIFPLLETHGYKGSFGYVTESSELGIENSASQMQLIYNAGHEIQDHTTRHNYMWATHIDTLRDEIVEWIPYPLVDVPTWDSLCERSLFIIDSLGMHTVGWNEPGGGVNTIVPDHPEWSWRGACDDSLYEVIASKYSYALAFGVYPQTAHMNLRGHNCPDRYPFFCVPHWTIDDRAMADVITDMADAVESGLWYLAVSHGRDLHQVAQVETLVEWLSTTDIEVVTCGEGVERVTLGYPDPCCNQFPQAKMTIDRDGNNKPDGFTGACEWDTVTTSPVEGASCIKIYGDAEFMCYGPEVGRHALSIWLRYPGPASGLVRICWSQIDFDWNTVSDTMVSASVGLEWTLVDSTLSRMMILDIGEEVDRIRVLIRPIACTPLLASYPSLLLDAQAGVYTPGRPPEGPSELHISPNPVRRGDVVSIAPAGAAILYDIMGRHVLTPELPHGSDVLKVDAAGLAPGVYFVSTSQSGQARAKIVVIP